jgi:hypothetical protein
MKPDSVLMRVARAIHDVDCDNSDCGELTTEGRYARYAQAAINALDPIGEHVIDICGAHWTIKHPLSCRPDLFACPYHESAVQSPWQLRPGRYKCTLVDGTIRLGDPL